MLQSILIFLTPVGGIDNMPMVILLILVTCGNLISFGLLVLLWLLAQQKGWNWLYHIARFMLVSMLIGLATAFSNAIQTSFGNALGIYLSCLITGMAAGVLATIAEGIQALLNHLRPSRLVGLALFVISSGVIVILSLFIVHFLLRNPF